MGGANEAATAKGGKREGKQNCVTAPPWGRPSKPKPWWVPAEFLNALTGPRRLWGTKRACTWVLCAWQIPFEHAHRAHQAPTAPERRSISHPGGTPSVQMSRRSPSPTRDREPRGIFGTLFRRVRGRPEKSGPGSAHPAALPRRLQAQGKGGAPGRVPPQPAVPAPPPGVQPRCGGPRGPPQGGSGPPGAVGHQGRP